jgi:hypothetical protein
MVSRGRRIVTTHCRLSVCQRANYAVNAVNAIGLDAIAKQLRIEWLIRQPLFE